MKCFYVLLGVVACIPCGGPCRKWLGVCKTQRIVIFSSKWSRRCGRQGKNCIHGGLHQLINETWTNWSEQPTDWALGLEVFYADSGVLELFGCRSRGCFILNIDLYNIQILGMLGMCYTFLIGR